jgi:hypothetical protein
LFNDWIERWRLIDVKDPTKSFTWSNNQACPVMVVLDRILINVQCDAKYPLAKVDMLPKGVSDHNPLRIEFGGKIEKGDYIFRFEKWWLKMEEFENLVKECWSVECHEIDPVDRWQIKMRRLRKKIKGWSWNRESELKKEKEKILCELEALDNQAENNRLNSQEIDRRKELKAHIDKMWRVEEIKARQ